jgi:hypothetical protein
MQHVAVQLPGAPWLAHVAHTVVAAWAASADLTLEELDRTRVVLDEMLATLLTVSDGPVMMRLSSASLDVELSAPLRSSAGDEHAVLRSSLRRHRELP